MTNIQSNLEKLPSIIAGWTVSAGQVSWVAYEVTSNQEEFTPSC